MEFCLQLQARRCLTKDWGLGDRQRSSLCHVDCVPAICIREQCGRTDINNGYSFGAKGTITPQFLVHYIDSLCLYQWQVHKVRQKGRGTMKHKLASHRDMMMGG